MSESTHTPLVPAGFRMAGVHAGLKRNPKKEDLTLIVADSPCVAAGVYTQNVVYAAPVEVDRQRTPTDDFCAVIINSGNANACTGERGLEDALRMTQVVADAINAEEEQVLVMSTGIIGHYLPMDKIEAGVAAVQPILANDANAFEAAARGILTTDKSIKVGQSTVATDSGDFQISAMAKGAGMIGPRMATLLAVVMTDAALSPADAQLVLNSAVNESFNAISVEGHTSTNDTVLLLASGAASNEPLTGDCLDTFRTELTNLCIDLAKQIPADGEGATHLIEITVQGAASVDDARQIAETIASSALVKTAVTGNDPNWGRIVSAAGYSGPKFDPAGVDLRINDHLIYEKGMPAAFNEAAVSQSMKQSAECKLQLTLREGSASARHWTSDLTVEYVTFNSDYRT